VPKSSSVKKRKTRFKLDIHAPKLLMRFIFGRRALSVAVSTMIITASVIAMGIAVMGWTYSWGNIANKQYMDNMAAGSNAMGERIGFECISYSGSDLTVNMINWGKTNNITIARAYIWDSNQVPVASFSGSDVVLKDITSPHSEISGNVLGIGKDGCIIFTVGLNPDSYYTIRVVTDRGRNFDGSFGTSP
jgi:hypothetical protein